ncbi:hypothetical protein Fmac_007789 [Flemingia macrophylla]|uniref:Uncharacterized protein n=1 Tax=Flemingia macrophylla TaxID=520843 RepID=A0ABD1MVM9_9FABA
MACFVSNHSLLGSCPCSTPFPFSSNPFQTLKSKILSFPSRPFPPALISSLNRTTPFKSSPNPPPTTNDEIEETRSDNEDNKPLPSLMVLVKAYKEAFFNGDENSVALIEEGICSIANRKNKLVQRVSTLLADKAASKDKYIRLQADFDNFRKRIDKERLNIQSEAQQEVIEKLLLMVDNFERTKQQTKAVTEKEKKIDVSYQGIYKQFVEILRSHHVSVVATVGKPFNPLILLESENVVLLIGLHCKDATHFTHLKESSFQDMLETKIWPWFLLVEDIFILDESLEKQHEAIAREVSAEFKKGIVIKESRRGFMLRDKVLRPARVKVSLGPGNKESPVSHDKSVGQPSTAAGIDER